MVVHLPPNLIKLQNQIGSLNYNFTLTPQSCSSAPTNNVRADQHLYDLALERGAKMKVSISVS
jgi:hypothetical protein